MIWTHKYDLLVKIICIIITCLFIILITNYLESAGLLFAGKLFALAIMTTILAVFLIMYQLFFRTLGSLLYARHTLKMTISFSEARKLNKAFAPLLPLNKQWLPMHEIIDINDSEEKYHQALAIARHWDDQNKSERAEKISEFRNSSNSLKVTRIILYILLAWCFIAGILNLPPASYITAIYTRIFDSNRYYPMLNICILALPLAILFSQIEKWLKKH